MSHEEIRFGVVEAGSRGSSGHASTATDRQTRSSPLCQRRERRRIRAVAFVTPLLWGVGLLLVQGGCAVKSPRPDSPSRMQEPTIRYVGSSTIANFIRQAEKAYPAAQFDVDTRPESLGGERLIRLGADLDLVGCAKAPDRETLDSGVRASYLGADTIVVIVNAENPLTSLTVDQLRRIYSGEVTSWQELGGRDMTIVPLVVGETSATRTVFQDKVLGAGLYSPRCHLVFPDRDIPMNVEEEPAAIGMISFSFLCSSGGAVRVLNVEGEAPHPDNVTYPIRRPLYLLWRPGNPAVTDFVAWTSTLEAEEILSECFGGARFVDAPPRPIAP